MPLYDLMLLLDPGVPSDRQETILRDVQTQLESGGNLVGSHDWGTRRMTFEIDHRPEAAYHLFQFETEGGGALLERVDHSLKIMDGVLRHRIIRLKDGSPPPPTPSPDRRGGYEGYEGADLPAATETAGEPDSGEARPDVAEVGEPVAAAATADSAAAEQAPAADVPAAAPAETETPAPSETAEQDAGPADGGGDDDAPSGPPAA
jgi:small subunit ribosomal protein S6